MCGREVLICRLRRIEDPFLNNPNRPIIYRHRFWCRQLGQPTIHSSILHNRPARHVGAQNTQLVFCLRCARLDSVPWAPGRGVGPGLVHVASFFVGQPLAGACLPGAGHVGGRPAERAVSPRASARGWHSRFVSKPGHGQASGSVAPGGRWALIRSVGPVTGRLGWLTIQMMAAPRLLALGFVTSRMTSAHRAGFSVSSGGAEASVNAQAPGSYSP